MSLAPVIELARYRRDNQLATSCPSEPDDAAADGFGADIVSLDERRREREASKRRHPTAVSAGGAA